MAHRGGKLDLGGHVYIRRFLLSLAVIAIALIQWSSSALASVSASPPQKPTASTTSNSCAYPDALVKAGLLTDAEGQYEKILDSTNGAGDSCAAVGLKTVEDQRQQAVQLEASGDQAAAEGDLDKAKKDYQTALSDDRDNQAAMSGLQKVDQQTPNSIRQVRDYWGQVVSNTLVPIGQFFLSFLAVCAGFYVLYLLVRVGARWLPLRAKPSWRRVMKPLLWSFLALAAAAAGAYIGIAAQQSAWSAGGWWLTFLIVAAGLVVTGCLLLAWYLRSGTGVQFSVINKDGNADEAASAFLAGRLNALGASPPRGFDLPQDTDVTSLSSALALLPGGGILSALADFFLVRLQITPWNCVVTLIDQDRLLVTVHLNGRLAHTVLADRHSLFFPVPGSGGDTEAASPHVQDIDQSGMLTIAAAIILAKMAAEDGSPLERGLNGATSWESIAGQVLATQQGFSENEDLSKALLTRAIDVDPANLGARVAQIVMAGRRAKDAPSRREFADQISKIGCGEEFSEVGFEALQLRVLYSAAVGWYNVYLDNEEMPVPKMMDDHNKPRDSKEKVDTKKKDPLTEAFEWSKRLIDHLSDPEKSVQGLTKFMLPMAYMIGASLECIPSALRDPSVPALSPVFKDWNPDKENPENPEDSRKPKNSEVLYAWACLAAAEGDRDKPGTEAQVNHYGEALTSLRETVKVNADLRIWARYDPSFKQLFTRDREKFLKITSDTPTSVFTGVGPLADHATQLNDVGAHTAAELLDMTSTGAERQLMAQALGVSQLVVARWRNIALLNVMPGGPDPGQLDVLIAQGVDSPKVLQGKNRKAIAELAEKIQTATKYSQVTITKGDLAHWVRSAKRQHIRAAPEHSRAPRKLWRCVFW